MKCFFQKSIRPRQDRQWGEEHLEQLCTTDQTHSGAHTPLGGWGARTAVGWCLKCTWWKLPISDYNDTNSMKVYWFDWIIYTEISQICFQENLNCYNHLGYFREGKLSYWWHTNIMNHFTKIWQPKCTQYPFFLSIYQVSIFL